MPNKYMAKAKRPKPSLSTKRPTGDVPTPMGIEKHTPYTGSTFASRMRILGAMIPNAAAEPGLQSFMPTICAETTCRQTVSGKCSHLCPQLRASSCATVHQPFACTRGPAEAMLSDHNQCTHSTPSHVGRSGHAHAHKLPMPPGRKRYVVWGSRGRGLRAAHVCVGQPTTSHVDGLAHPPPPATSAERAHATPPDSPTGTNTT